MTALWLVRHGQTDWNTEGRYQGHTDRPLNATGVAQAAELAAKLAGQTWAAVYSSDLARARTTAEVLAERSGVAVRVDARLREIGLGNWEGLQVAQIQSQEPEAWEARRLDPVGARPAGGESVAELAARMAAAADDMAARHGSGPVLVVSHGLALATLICQARGWPLAEAFERVPDNCTPEIIEWQPAPERRAA